MNPGTRRRAPRIAAASLAAVLLCTAGGCVFTRDAVSPLTAVVPEGRRTLEVRKPAKAHLKDGSVVLYPQGFTVVDGELRGPGEQYDLTRTRRTLVTSVAVAQVAAIEGYAREVRPLLSLAGTVVGAPVFLLGGVLGLFILFSI